VYNISSRAAAAALENYATSGTPNSEVDTAFVVKPGASRPVSLIALRGQGKGAGLTALSGIALRIKIYPTTAAAGGSAITPNPTDNRAPAATGTAAAASTAAGTVTAGTGTLVHVGGIGFGASGPGGWVAPNPDGAITIDGGATRSADLFSSAGTASLNFEWACETQE
jgi:hypothetical protein